MLWAEDATARLRELHQLGGLSSREIAGRLSHEFKQTFTRNAVIGKLSRLGLSGGKPRGTLTGAKVTKIRSVRSRSVTVRKPDTSTGLTEKHQRSIEAAAAYEEVVYELNPETNVNFAGLEDGMCRWPVGDDLYCGGPIHAPRKSYCAVHDAAKVDVTRTKRSVENDTKRKSRPWR